MILIIGAGISGLAMASEFEKSGVEYLLLESSSQPGGCINSIWKNGYLLELGPNTILADHLIKTFISRLNLDKEVTVPPKESTGRYIYKKGKVQKLPSGPVSFLFGNFFSWKTKKAIFREMNLRSAGNENETVGDFFERRFTKELVDYAVDPFVSGIFAGDPYKLLLNKTFPFLLHMEKTYGSVINGFLKSPRTKKESLVFHGGISKLTNALASRVSSVQYNTKVLSLSKRNGVFNVLCERPDGKITYKADQVVFTCPSYIAADILAEYNREASEALNRVNYCPMIKVFAGFKKKDIGLYPEGYGVLNPACEKQFSLGTLWSTSVNHLASPADSCLFTVMVGGENNKDKTLRDDSVIIDKVVEELKKNYKIDNNPELTYLYRIPRAIPQYDVNILEADSVIRDLEKDGIIMCVNWHKGASVSDCIKKALEVAGELEEETRPV